MGVLEDMMARLESVNASIDRLMGQIERIEGVIERIGSDVAGVAERGKGSMSTKEAAEYLGITPQTLNNLTSKRKVAYYKCGSLNYYKPSDLDDYRLRARVCSKEELDRKAAAYVATHKLTTS